MSIETSIYAAIKSLVSGRVYRDIAPAKDPAGNPIPLPRITFQAVGGEAINFLDSATIPSKRRARVQINCWHSSRDAANALARQVEDTLRTYTALQTTVMGGFVAVHEPNTGLFGTIQDFGFFG